MSDQEKSTLPLRDYVLAASICSLFVFLAISSFYKPYPLTGKAKVREVYAEAVEHVQVLVKGHVKHPGSYWVERGSSLGDLLDRAEPLEFADLRRMKRSTPLKRPRKIDIKELATVTIYFYGAVEEPGPHIVPAHTRLMDLPKFITFPDGADLSPLRRKRKVKSQEEFLIEELV